MIGAMWPCIITYNSSRMSTLNKCCCISTTVKLPEAFLKLPKQYQPYVSECAFARQAVLRRTFIFIITQSAPNLDRSVGVIFVKTDWISSTPDIGTYQLSAQTTRVIAVVYLY